MTAALKPHTPEIRLLRQTDHNRKEKQAVNYNTRHRARNHTPWNVGDMVWIPDLNTEATVTQKLPFHSYQLCTAANHLVRRNSRSLRPPLPTRAASPTSSSTSTQPTVALSRCRTPEPVPVAHALPPPAARPQQPRQLGSPYITRAGRAVRPHKKLTRLGCVYMFDIIVFM